MTRRHVLLAILLLGAWLAAGVPGSLSLAGETCPKCGVPRDPSAAFCVNCGYKFTTAAAAAAPAAKPSVVQVVAAHDAELTSTLSSIVWGQKMRVDSLLGSAFAIGEGEFLTDSGLLVGAKDVALRTPSGRTVPAQVVGSDPMIGVALLKAQVDEVAPLAIRHEEPARIGEPLNAVGYPSELQAHGEPARSTGVVSGLHRGHAGIHPIEDYIQSDASLPRGLAGGPMLDGKGRVLGMSTGFVMGSRVVLGPENGIGLAVPSEWLERGLAWIRSGSPARGWIGALAVGIDPETRARYKLPPEARLVVEHVFPNSPAAAAGLVRGDGLLEVGGSAATTLPALQQRLMQNKPGDTLPLKIARGGEPRDVNVTLQPRPDRPRLSGADALRYFGDLEIEMRGDELVVGTVESGSQPAGARIASGDVLKSVLSKKDWEHGAVDNSRWRSVKSLEELESRLETAYSDFDFALGLRFKGKDGAKREMYVWEILTPTPAL
jgi:S1-C subfamily serine protease